MDFFSTAEQINVLVNLFATGAVVAVGLFAFALALQRRLLRKRPEETTATIGGITKEEVEQIQRATKDERPFEVAALASYYNQALSRANISFWFSLFFASVGFVVIVMAFVTHTSGNIADTLIKVISGTVIDAVSALFFVQSTNAQKSMSDFFEKLRFDRLNAEAREMISEIEDPERRDQLRAQLVIKYSGIEKLIEGGNRQIKGKSQP